MGDFCLGWPLAMATQALDKRGIAYEIEYTEEPKKQLHGNDARVVRVVMKEGKALLTASMFITQCE